MNDATASRAVSVVVPVFNEEENMSILQSELRIALADLDYEIVFVDDGSIDRSAEKIETAPNIRVSAGLSATTERSNRCFVLDEFSNSASITCVRRIWIPSGPAITSGRVRRENWASSSRNGRPAK